MVKINDRAGYLHKAVGECISLLDQATTVEGGDTVPKEAFQITIDRLARLALLMQGALPIGHRQCSRGGKGKGKAKVPQAAPMGAVDGAGCNFASQESRE